MAARVAGFVVIVMLRASGAAHGAELSATLPPGVPSFATLGTWQKIDGKIETATATVHYEFYVNPRREALYEVTRYRVTQLSRGPDGSPRRVPATEKFLWNAHPGTGERLWCFELRRPGGWTRLDTHSREYQEEMRTAVYVYDLQNQDAHASRP